MPVVYSTLASAQGYAIYEKAKADDNRKIQMPIKVINIKGGAGVANQNLFTPRGVATQVTQEQLDDLLTIPDFQLHMKNGFIKVEGKERKMEKALSDMSLKDPSAPRTPEYYKNKQGLKPVLNSSSSPRF